MESGATVRDQHRVVELVRDRERVGRGRGGHAERPGDAARRHRHRCRRKGLDHRGDDRASKRYEHFVLDRGGYWGYFPTPGGVARSPSRYDCDGIIAFEGDGLRYVFQCDGGLLLLAGVPPVAEARSWRKESPGSKLLAYLAASELTEPLVREAEPVGKLVGLHEVRVVPAHVRSVRGSRWSGTPAPCHRLRHGARHRPGAVVARRRSLEAVVDGRPACVRALSPSARRGYHAALSRRQATR